MTAMVGMIDPPRAESKDAVENAQAANIRVRMVTGDDVYQPRLDRHAQLGIPGEAILVRGLRSPVRGRAAGRIHGDRRRGPGGARAQSGADGGHPAEEG